MASLDALPRAPARPARLTMRRQAALAGYLFLLPNIVGFLVFSSLPVLATLSSFAFLVLACIVSRRFVLCALGMFAAGALMARFPAYGFLIYGGAWLAVLQTIALLLWRRRKRWLTDWQPAIR